MSEDLLVVGYGNPLRRDDGLGPFVAKSIADWQISGVRVCIAHQLTPELADEIWSLSRVLFTDASYDARTAQLMKIQAVPGYPRLGHTGDPGHLLALTEAIYGRAPAAWLLTLPGRDFDFGEGLSTTAREAATAALEWLRPWLSQSATAMESEPCTRSA